MHTFIRGSFRFKALQNDLNPIALKEIRMHSFNIEFYRDNVTHLIICELSTIFDLLRQSNVYDSLLEALADLLHCFASAFSESPP